MFENIQYSEATDTAILNVCEDDGELLYRITVTWPKFTSIHARGKVHKVADSGSWYIEMSNDKMQLLYQKSIILGGCPIKHEQAKVPMERRDYWEMRSMSALIAWFNWCWMDKQYRQRLNELRERNQTYQKIKRLL